MLKKIQQFFKDNLELSNNDSSTQQHKVDLAAAALLIELSRADFDISSIEQQAIEQALVKTLGLAQTELNELIALAEAENQQATSLYEFTRHINEAYTPEQKFELLKALWQVAVADGEISKYEDHLIRKIADLIYAPHSDFIKSKLAVINN
ncbi:TerB family tellurite resistance protein [Dasania sp. GY-MA-18]|uniref:TerB family tellurite resistance protein n=1 Tax=Dasania phycosphaerae TaxID=2950436 RepID=A0A9J6RPN0_9GAMM|nr:MULTISPECIES: TerB family tellurite resistance protein [Dasania]MCR8923555.1 TerB family tellurite resistance protein [Dasania sp. GY-MA-18]MCZ0865989.1 TerB family tellurite resistance protein [Dasania phycosphaerae]MCZ0869713.1 TerB family tellurite resistance protein [Dasania phycosphaerae]